MRSRTAKIWVLLLVGLLVGLSGMGGMAQPPQGHPTQEWGVMFPQMLNCCEQGAACACQAVNNTEQTIEQNNQIQTTVDANGLSILENREYMEGMNSSLHAEIGTNGDLLFSVAYTLGQMSVQLENLNNTVEECCCMDSMGPQIPTIHGPDKHTNRTQTLFIRGKGFVADTGIGVGVTEFANIFWAGLKMPDAAVNLIGAPFPIPPNELRGVSDAVPIYIHLKENDGNAGDVKFDINIYGQDSSGSPDAFPVGSPAVTMAGSDYKRVFIANVNLSTLNTYDIAGVTIERTGTSIQDTLAGDIIVMGIEMVFPSDQ